MQNSERPRRGFRPSLWLIIGVLLIAGAVFWAKRGGSGKINGTVFVVRRGTLPINVIEGGSIEALESQEIRSEYKGYQGTKILNIVEEGYLVTEEDVKKGKVLVELDSSELKQKITTQDIQFQSTLASLTEAQQAYDIQYNQNKSDIKTAEQKVRFALMDLEKFLGADATKDAVAQLMIIKASEEPMRTNAAPNRGSIDVTSGPQFAQLVRPGSREVATDVPLNALTTGASAVQETKTPTNVAPPIDFSKYAKLELLGDGEAKQKLRKFDDDLLVAKSEHGLAKTQFDGTQRLSEKGFVTKSTLANEEITVKKGDLKVQTAELARDLFIKYEFPKTAEEFLSKYEEAARLLDRAKKEAVSKLAQAEAKLRSAEGRFRIEQEQRKDMQEQMDKCVIRAKKTGLVVYGGGGDSMMYYGGQEQIREGATVRERQPIITIPDMTQMSVKVKIHESHIKKISRGMKARIRIDAFPDEVLEAEVIKVGVLPDSQNRWMNPDLKVYLTSLKIVGVRDWLKPGMSAKVEIMVKNLPDVIHVPIQAVTPTKSGQICYVVRGNVTESRPVEVGEFNDEFIAIKSGLKEGERVLLRAPEGSNQEEDKSKEEEAKPKSDAPAGGGAVPAKSV